MVKLNEKERERDENKYIKEKATLFPGHTIVIDRQGDYSLLIRVKENAGGTTTLEPLGSTPYIVAFCLETDLTKDGIHHWGQGYYFDKFSEAMDCYHQKTRGPQYVPIWFDTEAAGEISELPYDTIQEAIEAIERYTVHEVERKDSLSDVEKRKLENLDSIKDNEEQGYIILTVNRH